MIMNLIAIGIVLGVGYTWVTRGFLSAFLHMVCVIIAGAIAFAAWEPVAILLLEKAPGNFLSFLGDAAWGLGLALPFAISLAVLRLITDSIVRANMAVDDAMNYVGGGVCGAVSGVITAGIFVNAVGFLRVPQSFLGYQPVAVANQGNFEIQQNLWLPVDRLTGQLYNHLSQHTLSTTTPLATYVPDLATAAGTQRMTAGEGKNRNTLRPDSFEVLGWFTVGENASRPEDVFSDFMDSKAQAMTDLAGNPITDAYSIGFIIKFTAAARESFGQVVASKGQLRLITQDQAGNTQTVFPIAVTTQASAGEDVYGRFRFVTEGDHIASVGGAADTTMAFEFPVERGHTPLALHVRNVRHTIEGSPDRTFADAAGRDLAIQTGQLIGTTRVEDLDTSIAVEVPTSNDSAPGLDVSVRLPRKYSLQDSATRGIEINDNKQVIGGDEKFEPGFLGARVDAALRIDEFFVTSDTNIVQLTVTGDPTQIPSSLFGAAWTELDLSKPARLVDTNGQVYPAVGFIYEDRSLVHLRYSPSQPIRTLGDAPALSRTRDDQSMIMLFRISEGVQLQHFAIGELVITTYEPPITIPKPRFRTRR